MAKRQLGSDAIRLEYHTKLADDIERMFILLKQVNDRKRRLFAVCKNQFEYYQNLL